jgi:two-component system, chemotaxis family, protein-glutamate methylesterase/glutaminase
MFNILIVEDNHSTQFAYRKFLTLRGYKVDVGNNGAEGLELVKKNNYDLIIADWLMPVMDGIDLISKIRSQIKKQPIIFLLTAVNSSDARKKALFAGADEYLTKPISLEILLSRIEVAINKKSTKITKQVIKNTPSIDAKKFYCVGIAASTGGPGTLVKFFSSLGVIKNAVFLIVLHGPEWFLKSFVTSLQEITKIKVHLGKNGIEIQPGNIYIAPGNFHMVLKDNSSVLELIDTPPENFVKPSADPLFKSIASSFGNKSIGMVFTGMGKDGAYGAGYIQAASGKVFVQDPKTAVLPSMPEAVIKFNMADEIVPLDIMAIQFKKYL